MKKTYLILRELEETLQCWEDLNLFGRVMFKLLQITKQPILQGMLKAAGIRKPYIGSELDNRGFFTRDIKNYEMLRMALENGSSVSQTDFLPRVPTESRNWLSQIQLSRATARTPPIHFFPYMLSRWLEFKKVFSIENTQLIPSIDVSKENHLLFLPFQSFILRFENKLEFELLGSGEIKTFVSCICSVADGILDVLCFPEKIKEHSMKTEIRQFYKKVATDPKVLLNSAHLLTSFDPGKSSLKGMLKFSVDLKTGDFLMDSPEHLADKGETYQIHYDFDNFLLMFRSKSVESGRIFESTVDKLPNSVPVIAKDLASKLQTIKNLINGFSYSLQKLKSTPTPLVIPGIKQSQKEIDRNDQYGWNAIPITQTQFLKPSDEDSQQLVIITGNSDKSPHYRRGHWRVIISKDGSKKQIWIDTMLIRGDKLETEDLKGSVVKIKEKKENKT